MVNWHSILTPSFFTATHLERHAIGRFAAVRQTWGYKLLARFPNDSLPILTPGLADDKLVMRERATVAIGYIGRAARAARPQVVRALGSSNDERERLLLRWCLQELD